MMRKLLLILATVAAACAGAGARLSVSAADVDALLSRLDDSLAVARHIIARRQADIDRLTDSLHARPTDAGLLLRIADRYTAFNNDSAMRYLQAGMVAMPAADARAPFILRLASLLPLSGFTETALDLFGGVDTTRLSVDDIRLYHEAGRQMYSYMAAFAASNPALHRQLSSLAVEHQRRLLTLLPRGSDEHTFNLGEYYLESGFRGKAKVTLEQVNDKLPLTSNMKARAAHHLSTLARAEGDSLAYTYYLAQAALSDVCAATREMAALQELGHALYTQGDLDRAYSYLTAALAAAVECGAPLRMIESSRSLPIIEQAKTEQIVAKQRIIMLALVIMALLAVVLGVLIYMLRREMRHQADLQHHLRQANRIKDLYISQFLNMCSVYMDKLNQFCKIVNRKITAGKVDDLYKLTKSGKFVEEQSRDFYDVFDSAFIHLYPDFVERVNDLLRPEARIVLPEGERLNTDLRILAFMRLGIDDSSRIAQVLNYSLNTIYAYRNRIKARAVSRDTFEADIMRIPSGL